LQLFSSLPWYSLTLFALFCSAKSWYGWVLAGFNVSTRSSAVVLRAVSPNPTPAHIIPGIASTDNELYQQVAAFMKTRKESYETI
jgi:hypothetical protein